MFYQPRMSKVAVTIIKVSEQSLFDEVLCCKGLVLLICVDSQYNQSGTLHSVIDELAEAYQSVIRFCQINTTDNPSFKKQVQPENNPVFMLIRNGDVIDERYNIVERDQLEYFLESHL